MNPKLLRFIVSVLMLVLLAILYVFFSPTSLHESGKNSRNDDVVVDQGATSGSAHSERVLSEVSRKGLHHTGNEPSGEGRIFGKVLYANSQKPVPCARVLLGRSLVGNSWGQRWKEVVVESGKNGQFEFVGVRPGTWRLIAEKEDMISYKRLADANIVDLGEDTAAVGPLVLFLQPTSKLTVEVRSEADDGIIENAEINLLRNKQQTYLTEQNGKATLFLSPEIWELKIAASGFQLAYRIIDLTEGGDAAITVFLKQGGAFFGKVSDEKGIPLAEVEVSVRFSKGLIETETDVNGMYHIQNLPLEETLNLGFVKKDYEILMLKKQGVSGPPKTQELNVQLTSKSHESKVRVLRGRVVDGEKTPVANARVGIGYKGLSSRSETYTDQDGQFEISVGSRMQWLSEIWTTAEGFAPRSVKLNLDQDLPFLEIVLFKGYSIQGQVVDTWGSPVDAVRVQPYSYERRAPLHEDKGALTDVNGSFAFHSLPDRAKFSFYKSGFSPIDGLLLPVGGKDPIEVTLHGPGVVYGRVIEKETGNPVVAYNLKVFDEGLKMGLQSAHINHYWGLYGVEFNRPDGSFRLENLAFGSVVNLIVETGEGALATIEKLNVLDETHAAPITIQIPMKSLVYEGRVVSPTGTGLAGIEVSLAVYKKQRSNIRFAWANLDTPGSPILKLHSTVSDSNGFFRFERLPEDLPIDLLVRHEGLALTRVADLEAMNEKQRKALVVVVPKGGSIFGSINTQNLPDVRSVSLFAEGMTGMFFHKWLSGGIDHYRFDNLPPGIYEAYIEFEMEGNRSRPRMTRAGLELEEGASFEVNFGFKPGYKVEGVVYINGSPLAQGSVFLRDIQGGQPSSPLTRTDSSGRFSFEKIEPGQYEVIGFDGVVTGYEYHDILFRHPNREVIEVGDEDYFGEFYFNKFGDLTGRVSPPPEKTLQLILRGGEQGQATHRSGLTLPAGQFQFETLPPGEYELLYRESSSTAPAKTLKSGIIMPSDGSDFDLGVLELEQLGSLRVMIDGHPPDSGVAVYLLPETASPTDRSQAIVAGRLDATESGRLLKGLSSGVFLCRALVSDGSWASNPEVVWVEIVMGEVSEVHFSFQPLTMLSVTSPFQHRLQSLSLERQGQVIKFRESESLDIFSSGTEPLAVFQPYFGQARGVPDGEWMLKAINVRGQAITKKVTLRSGVAQSLKLVFN